MKTNIIIALLSVICGMLGYIAAQITTSEPAKTAHQQNQRTTVSPTAQKTEPQNVQTTDKNIQQHQPNTPIKWTKDNLIDGGIISRPAPNYPTQSAENGEEGIVEIEIFVETNGTVSSARIAKSSGYARLDNAAFRAFKNDIYKPINHLRTKYIVKTMFSLD